MDLKFLGCHQDLDIESKLDMSLKPPRVDLCDHSICQIIFSAQN